MTTPNGKHEFDAAIDSIRGYLRVMEAYPSKHEKDIAESYAAIHILEAAGKIPIYDDEGRLFTCYKDKEWTDFCGALFDALPDKEKP